MTETVERLLKIVKELSDIVDEQFAIIMQHVELNEVDDLFNKMQNAAKEVSDIEEKVNAHKY